VGSKTNERDSGAQGRTVPVAEVAVTTVPATAELAMMAATRMEDFITSHLERGSCAGPCLDRVAVADVAGFLVLPL